MKQQQQAGAIEARALVIGAYAGLEGLIEIMEKDTGTAVVHLDSIIAVLRPLTEQLGCAVDRLESESRA